MAGSWRSGSSKRSGLQSQYYPVVGNDEDARRFISFFLDSTGRDSALDRESGIFFFHWDRAPRAFRSDPGSASHGMGKRYMPGLHLVVREGCPHMASGTFQMKFHLHERQAGGGLLVVDPINFNYMVPSGWNASIPPQVSNTVLGPLLRPITVLYRAHHPVAVMGHGLMGGAGPQQVAMPPPPGGPNVAGLFHAAPPPPPTPAAPYPLPLEPFHQRGLRGAPGAHPGYAPQQQGFAIPASPGRGVAPPAYHSPPAVPPPAARRLDYADLVSPYAGQGSPSQGVSQGQVTIPYDMLVALQQGTPVSATMSAAMPSGSGLTQPPPAGGPSLYAPTPGSQSSAASLQQTIPTGSHAPASPPGLMQTPPPLHGGPGGGAPLAPPSGLGCGGASTSQAPCAPPPPMVDCNSKAPMPMPAEDDAQDSFMPQAQEGAGQTAKSARSPPTPSDSPGSHQPQKRKAVAGGEGPSPQDPSSGETALALNSMHETLKELARGLEVQRLEQQELAAQMRALQQAPPAHQAPAAPMAPMALVPAAFAPAQAPASAAAGLLPAPVQPRLLPLPAATGNSALATLAFNYSQADSPAQNDS